AAALTGEETRIFTMNQLLVFSHLLLAFVLGTHMNEYFGSRWDEPENENPFDVGKYLIEIMFKFCIIYMVEDMLPFKKRFQHFGGSLYLFAIFLSFPFGSSEWLRDVAENSNGLFLFSAQP
ncbi:Hypothetical predicted protein, partial [Pelobates cultripes]